MSLRTEDELNGMSIREVYGLWKEANEEEKKYISDYMERRVLTVSSSDKLEDTNGDFLGEYELVAAIKIAYNNKSGKAPKEVLTLVGAAIKSVEGDRNISSLQKNLRKNALIEAQSVLNSGVSGVSETSKKNGNIIATNLKAKKADDLLPEEIKDFNDADETGGLDNVDPAVVEQLRREIAKLTNFNKVDGKTIEINDSVLAGVIGSLNNKHLFDKINVKLKFTEGEKGKAGYVETSPEQTKHLENVLKHNAALRATYDALSDKEFYDKYKAYFAIKDKKSAPAQKMAASIMEYFQDKIALNYQRSLVLARITTLNDNELLKNVKINRKTGRASYQEDDDKIAGVINDVEETISKGSEIELNPHTIGMDTYDMELENAKVSQALKTKNVLDKAKEKMKFFKTMKQGWKQATKDGGWKRVLGRGFVNFGIFGVSAAAISTGSAALIVPGAVAYAGWTWVNAKMMPVYDHIKAKLRNGKKLSFKERRKYIKENWKANKAEVYAQTRFKKRSNFRVSEGAVVAGVAGVTSFVAGPLWSRIARQTAMLGGKGITLGLTAHAEKKSKEQYLEDGHRRLAQYKEIKALEGQKTQDIVTLGAVAAGAAYVDSGAAAAVNNAVIGAIGLEDEVAAVNNWMHGLLHGNKNTAGANQAGDEGASADGNGNKGTDVEDQSGNNNDSVDDAELTTETETASTPFNPDDLSADDRAAYDRVLKRWGEDRVNTILDKMQEDGKIIDAHGREFAMPEGMSKAKVAEAFYYLSHWNEKNPHAKILGYLFYNDCDGKDTLAQYTPEQINTAINVLRAIDLGPDSIRTVVADGCPVETHTHGHIDIDKYNEITHSGIKPEYHLVRNTVEYDPCDGSLKGHTTRLASPCDNQPGGETHIDETYVDESHVDETPAREPQNYAVAPSSDIHFESAIPGTADEVQIHSGKGDVLQISKPEAVQSMKALHSDVADSLKASEEITVEQLQQIDNMLVEKKKFLGFIPYTVRHGSVNINSEHPEQSTIEFAGSWKPEGVDTDNTSVGTVRMTAQMWQESLNGNYGSHSVAQNIDTETLANNAQNIKYTHSENGQDYYDTGTTDKKGNAVRFAVPTPVRVDMGAGFNHYDTPGGGRDYAYNTPDGGCVLISLKNGNVTVSDGNGQSLIVDPRDRAPLTEVINSDLAALPKNDINKGGKVDLNPDRNSPQAAYEHSRYPDLVPFGNQEPELQAAPKHDGNQRDYFQEHYYPGRYGEFNTDAAKSSAKMDLAMMVKTTTRGGK